MLLIYLFKIVGYIYCNNKLNDFRKMEMKINKRVKKYRYVCLGIVN